MKFKQILGFAVLVAISAAVSCTGQKVETERVDSLEDLNGNSAAVLSGTVQDLFLSTNYPGCIVLRCDSEADAYTLMEAGRADAVMASSLCWLMAKKDFPDFVEVVGGIQPNPIGFAFDKSNKQLRDRFNVFLDNFFAETDKEQYIQDWLEDRREMPVAEDYAGSEGVLKFAVSANVPPFDFIREGQICGAEVELLARFAISENKKWEFVNVNFSGIINYLVSGKADIACSIMCITPERQQSVDFSKPWYEEASILLAKSGVSAAETKSFKDSIKDSIRKNLIVENRYKMLLQGLETTILIALFSALFGTLLGALLCFLSMHRNKLISCTSNVFIEFMRSMPQVVFLMIMYYVVFADSELSGTGVAIIAFSLCFGAYTSVIFRTSVNSIDKGQTEAALSMGFGRIRAFWHIILPQTVQRALPVYKGEFIGLIKATSIVGYIAVFDLTKAGDIIRSRTYEAFFPLILVTIIYFLIILVFTLLLKYVETGTRPKRKLFFK